MRTFDEPAVERRAVLGPDPRRMAVHVAGERLLAAVDDLHRPPRAEREHRPVDLHGQVLPAAERAADPGEVDPHLLGLEAEARRDLVAVDVEPLRGDVDVDAALAVRHDQPRLGPEERLVLGADLVDALDAHLARRVGIAVAEDHRADDVRPRVVEIAVPGRRAIRVDRLLLGRALRVDDRLERLGSRRRSSRPRAEPARGARRRPARRARRSSARGRSRAPAGRRTRARSVSLPGTSSCVSTAWTPGMPSAAETSIPAISACACGLRTVWPQSMSASHEVARVGELARRLRDPVDARDALADAAELELARCRRAHAPAASLTASRIFW